MKKRKVEEIILPYRKGTPLTPTVTLGDRIIDAVELMVKHNRKCIAVVRNDRPIGMILLRDAFETLGLQVPHENGMTH